MGSSIISNPAQVQKTDRNQTADHAQGFCGSHRTQPAMYAAGFIAVRLENQMI